MTAAFLAGAIAGYGVAVPVGAIAVLIAGLTARTSLRVGAAAGLGAATADGVYALIAVLGGAALAAAITPIATPLRWVAAVVLLLLAAHTAWSALRKRAAGSDPARFGPDAAGRAAGPGADREGVDPGAAALRGPPPVASDTTTAGRAYLGVLGLTLLNPATIVYFAALVMGRGGTGGGVWFVLGAFVASASWQLLIAGGGALVGRLLTGDRGRLITAMVSSVVIAVLAVGLVT
ncbi:LysE family transporter [Actinoplanes auranticolor]|uniref:Lysine transporter LysE n=1 Tax=Actinoplanes auranticolor TaxID=47988 RepID=A0A919SRJ6_9ACTN|nr:LysE family transporter [Actinoplanes auranticolor]GIM76619.1 lysine transporter LysE [Actinoplanes auranticolor]